MCLRSSREPTDKKTSFESMAFKQQIETILTGGKVAAQCEGPVVCDYSVEQHLKDSEMAYNESNAFKPVVKKTVTYIVIAVIFNTENEVLMIQESKSSCRGKWCFPMGRVEANEQLVDAVRRETLEESGLEIQPTALVIVDHSTHHWFRFAFAGQVIGGQLKTKEDKESIRALWYSDKAFQELSPLHIRGNKNSFVAMIQLTRNHNSVHNFVNSLRLPVIRAHNQMLLRIVFVVHSKQNEKHFILVSKAPTPHLPVCELFSETFISETIELFLEKVFKSHKMSEFVSIIGLLRVEHNGVPEGWRLCARIHDGICLTLLANSPVLYEDVPVIAPESGYTLVELMPPMVRHLNGLLHQHFQTITFRSTH